MKELKVLNRNFKSIEGKDYGELILNVRVVVEDKNKNITKRVSFFKKHGSIDCGYEDKELLFEVKTFIKKEYYDLLINYGVDFNCLIQTKQIEYEGHRSETNVISKSSTRMVRANNEIYYKTKAEIVEAYEYNIQQTIANLYKNKYKELLNIRIDTYLFGLTSELSIYAREDKFKMIALVGNQFRSYDLPAVRIDPLTNKSYIEQPTYYNDFKGFELIGIYDKNLLLQNLKESDIKQITLEELKENINEFCSMLNNLLEG